MSEETVLPVVDTAHHKDSDIEGDVTEDDPSIGSIDGGEGGPSQGKKSKKKKSKGKMKKKSKPSMDQTATDQGKEEESKPNKAIDDDEVGDDDPLKKALLCDRATGKFDAVTRTIIETIGKVDPNCADVEMPDGTTHTTVNYDERELCRYKWIYKLIEGFVRTQRASPDQLYQACKSLVEPGYFAALTPVVAELRWSR